MAVRRVLRFKDYPRSQFNSLPPETDGLALKFPIAATMDAQLSIAAAMLRSRRCAPLAQPGNIRRSVSSRRT
jgi:hypothetical protein